jgi:hypothetical protein
MMTVPLTPNERSFEYGVGMRSSSIELAMN